MRSRWWNKGKKLWLNGKITGGGNEPPPVEVLSSLGAAEPLHALFAGR